MSSSWMMGRMGPTAMVSVLPGGRREVTDTGKEGDRGWRTQPQAQGFLEGTTSRAKNRFSLELPRRVARHLDWDLWLRNGERIAPCCFTSFGLW